LKNINKKDIKLLVAPWLNWTEQPPPKGQVIGSNPIGVTTNTYKTWLIYRALCRSLQKLTRRCRPMSAEITKFLYKTCTKFVGSRGY
jgi:hypothetical protein